MTGKSSRQQVADTEPISSKPYVVAARHNLQRHLHAWLPKNKWLRRLVITLALSITVVLSGAYGIARWYQQSEKNKPTTLGVTYIASYASYLGLDPHETYNAILNDLGVKQLRLVSYWDEIEPSQGTYDFTELDWQMQQAEAHGAKVSLAIGLRQPRWPECHVPSWIDTKQPRATWQPPLEAYLATIVNRYKDSSALASYQLENEYYLDNFGTCTDHSQSRLISEFNVVKKLDSIHPVILSRSDNVPDWPPNEPKADLVGMSVYRRVWDGNVTKRYFTYPLPSWYYAFLAGVQKIRTGQDSILHELQTEAWPPKGQGILNTSLAEQNKSFDATRLETTVKFGKQTGLKHIDLWGAEYWYYRLVKLHDPSVWDEAKTIFQTQ